MSLSFGVTTDKALGSSLGSVVSPFANPTARRVAARYLDSREAVDASGTWRSTRRFGVGLLELVGASYADYQSLAKGQADLEDVGFEKSLSLLGPFAEGDPSIVLMERWVKERGLLCRAVALSSAPVLRITGSWQEYCDSKRGKFWHNLNRSQRQIESQFGPLEFKVLERPEDVEKAFPSCLELYRANWTRLTSRSFFLSDSGGRFLHDLMVELSREGKAEISRLEQRGELLAFSCALKMDSIYYFYVFATSKRPEFERFSIGKLFLRRLLESVFSRGMCAFDFMAGEEPYKFEWTRASRSRALYLVAPDTLAGRARLEYFLAARGLEARLKNNQMLRGLLQRLSLLLR